MFCCLVLSPPPPTLHCLLSTATLLLTSRRSSNNHLRSCGNLVGEYLRLVVASRCCGVRAERELRTKNCEQVSWQVCLRQVSKRRIAWAASRPVARSSLRSHLDEPQLPPTNWFARPTRHKPSSKSLLCGEQGDLSLGIYVYSNQLT